jgi:hypothetical protein
MATRKIFIDKAQNQVIPYLENNELIIELRNDVLNDPSVSFIKLDNSDAKEFISELYRIGKKITK